MALPPRIRTAVIPAAGQGTRMLPATKAVPKELLPILERPALQFIVDEALGAGVDHLVIVTSRSKPAIEQYFAASPEVEESLVKQGRGALAEQLRRYGNDVRISFAYQDAPRGLGHAVACARDFVGSEPFFVMLPDELMQDSRLLIDLATLTQKTGIGAVALKHMPKDELSRYGIVTPGGELQTSAGVEFLPIADVVEKPRNDEAPSDLAIIGRYALTPDIFDILEALAPGGTGEIQLTDALTIQAEQAPLHGVISTIGRCDVGNPLGWIEAVIEAGLDHPEFGQGLREWLREVL
ncbi:MAG: UTP--glucose-1-phosphate uridylyltransferase [Actinomycetota bacterium]|nr:UTP--glucose-1-phosphate uridylyltransferase [Actinomycetota bacterium]MDA3018689.1 UTP--glucose-1-phosphate uridylyltransferase [Actinomycetota bacterium]